MSFVICKKSKKGGEGTRLYYLVRNYRENGRVKRQTLIRMHEESSIQIILEKLERNRGVLRENIKACKDKAIEIETHKEDPKYYFAKLYLDTTRREEEKKLIDVVCTAIGIRRILRKYPLCSSRNSKLN